MEHEEVVRRERAVAERLGTDASGRADAHVEWLMARWERVVALERDENLLEAQRLRQDAAVRVNHFVERVIAGRGATEVCVVGLELCVALGHPGPARQVAEALLARSTVRGPQRHQVIDVLGMLAAPRWPEARARVLARLWDEVVTLVVPCLWTRPGPAMSDREPLLRGEQLLLDSEPLWAPDWRFWSLLGEVRFCLHDHRGALLAFIEVDRRFRWDEAALRGLSALLLRAEELEGALEVAERAVAAYPEDGSLRLSLGWARLLSGQLAEAEEALVAATLQGAAVEGVVALRSALMSARDVL